MLYELTKRRPQCLHGMRSSSSSPREGGRASDALEAGALFALASWRSCALCRLHLGSTFLLGSGSFLLALSISCNASSAPLEVHRAA